MFPTGELAKNAGKEVKMLLAIVAVAWITTTVISSIAHYRLAKVNKELAELQIAKLKAEGIAK
jgi:hypothetical protein